MKFTMNRSYKVGVFFDGSDLVSGLQQSLSRTMTLHMSGMNDAVARHACLHIDAIDE